MVQFLLAGQGGADGMKVQRDHLLAINPPAPIPDIQL